MNPQEAEAVAEKLNGLACIECTKGWLESNKRLTDPIQDIKDCGALGLITTDLQERLVSEVERINGSTN